MSKDRKGRDHRSLRVSSKGLAMDEMIKHVLSVKPPDDPKEYAKQREKGGEDGNRAAPTPRPEQEQPDQTTN